MKAIVTDFQIASFGLGCRRLCLPLLCLMFFACEEHGPDYPGDDGDNKSETATDDATLDTDSGDTGSDDTESETALDSVSETTSAADSASDSAIWVDADTDTGETTDRDTIADIAVDSSSDSSTATSGDTDSETGIDSDIAPPLVSCCDISVGDIVGDCATCFPAELDTELLASLARMFPDAHEVTAEESLTQTTFTVYLTGEPIGYAILSSSHGYEDLLFTLTGIHASGITIMVEVTAFHKREWVGARKWADDFDTFLGQFAGLDLSSVDIPNQDWGENTVDAVSGATVSSNAIIKTVWSSLEKYDSMMNIPDSDTLFDTDAAGTDTDTDIEDTETTADIDSD